MDAARAARIAGFAALVCAAAPAWAELPGPVRAMIDAAIATGDEGKVRTVAEIARATNPADGQEIDAILSIFEAEMAARRTAEAKAKEETIRSAGMLENWSGKGEFGAFRATGNSSNTGITAGLTVDRQGIDWRHRLTGRVDYQRANGVTTREQYLGRYEPNFNVSDNFYVYALAQYERDRFQGIAARYAVSGGMGYQALKNDDVQLSLKAGPAYRVTEFVDGREESRIAGLLALDFDWQITDRLRATAGVRYESGEQTVTPIDLFGGTPLASAAPLDNDYLLPAATVTWNFREDMQMRFGASRTIARPQFRELAPQQYLDPDSDRLFIGNPYLVDTELTNFDARWEWYFGEGEYLTVGGFYKQLDKPVEAIINEAASTVQQTYINAPEATLYGLETEFKKYFDLPFENAVFGDSRLFLSFNYTWTDTEVSVGANDVVFPLAGAGSPRPAAELVRDGSQLQGQSEHLANLQFGLEDASTGSQAILLVNHASDRISARGRPGQPDLVQAPGTMVDLVLRRGFEAWGQDLSVSFEVRNLLGEEYQEFQELGGGRVDINRYELGTSFSLSVTARY